MFLIEKSEPTGPPITELEDVSWALYRQSILPKESWLAAQAEWQELADHHPDTYAHSLRVGIYVAGLVRAEGREDHGQAQVDALLHDVGKRTVPPPLLDPQLRLNDLQRERIKQHAVDGYLLLAKAHRNNPAMALESAFVAGLHHKFQPTGYGSYGIHLIQAAEQHQITPEMLARFTSVARLIMLVDHFDAATTRNQTADTLTDEVLAQKRDEFLQTFPQETTRIDWLFANRIRR